MVENYVENASLDITRIETAPKVYVRPVDPAQGATGPWTHIPYLYWVMLKRTVSPVIGDATVEYLFGEQHRHDQLYESYYPPLALNGYQAALAIVHPTGQEEIASIGFLLEEETNYEDNRAANGMQRYKFYAMEYLFRQYEIDGSYVADTQGPLGRVRQNLSFNEPDDTLVPGVTDVQQQIRGNRDTVTQGGVTFNNFSPITVTGLNVEAPALQWSAWDVLEYWVNSQTALADQTPKLPLQGPTAATGIQYKLAVPPTIQQVLQQMVSIWSQKDMNLYEFFNALLPRELGLFWYLDYKLDPDNKADTIEFVVNSLANTTISFGSFSVVKNTNTIAYTAPSNPPFSHYTRLPEFKAKDSDVYSEIRIVGEPVVVMFNLSATTDADAVSAGTPFGMRPAWTPDLELSYQVPALGLPSQVNDLIRSNDMFRSVYREFELSMNWQWEDSLGQKIDILDTDGTFILDDMAPTFNVPNPKHTLGPGPPRCTLVGKRFERELPILQGYDYSVVPPAKKRTSSIGTGQVPIGAIVTNRNVGSPLFNREAWVDKLGDIPYYNKYFGGCHVTPAEDRPAIHIECDSPILLAKNHFRFTATDMTPPIAPFDYTTDLLFVLAIKTDFRLERIVPGAGNISGTRKVIEVPNCHLWIAMPNTAYDINEQTGVQITIAPGNEVLRNDAHKIDLVAGLVNNWMGTTRNLVSIFVEGTSITPPLAPPLGHMITNFQYQPPGTNQPTTIPVNATVTMITIDMQNQSMIIDTDYPTLDSSVSALLGLL